MYNYIIGYFIMGFLFGLMFTIDIEDIDDEEDEDYEIFKQDKTTKK